MCARVCVRVCVCCLKNRSGISTHTHWEWVALSTTESSCPWVFYVILFSCSNLHSPSVCTRQCSCLWRCQSSPWLKADWRLLSVFLPHTPDLHPFQSKKKKDVLDEVLWRVRMRCFCCFWYFSPAPKHLKDGWKIGSYRWSGRAESFPKIYNKLHYKNQ